MDQCEEEIWKPCPFAETKYLVSNLGRIKSLINKKFQNPIRKPWNNIAGYCVLSINTKNGRVAKTIHRLVALAFIPNPEKKKQINHKNGIKADNRVENLEWCTGSENIRHALDTNLLSFDFLKKKINQYDKDGVYLKTFASQTDAANDVGVDGATIRGVLSGEGIIAGGYMWRFYLGSTENISPARKKNVRGKPVDQFSLSGEFINRYESAQEASAKTDCWHQTIAKCCLGKRKKTGGYIWKYAA